MKRRTILSLTALLFFHVLSFGQTGNTETGAVGAMGGAFNVSALCKIIPYQGITTNCVNMSSIGLWLNGIPNIGIHPYLLHYSIAAYNAGFRPDIFSYFLNNN